ncbi:4-oxalomesaconate tautomerase [Streptomyces sp. NPDC052042]|uniref:4-oxalomesaconate tautomerase n=1 Tax=Streptomyces sp. NPDC052042 TaxID=3365683 RepID=UPI0037D52AD2
MSGRAIPCSVMRGGTSKGLFFLATDLPGDRADRDAMLRSLLGSPDPRQIDGLGGAHPLTSKVAVVRRSARPDADVDYLFLQVWPDRTEVSGNQNCGNMLAAVAPFAIEQGLVDPGDPVTAVRIWMENTRSLAVARVRTPGRRVRYDGAARIDGVPGTHAPILIDFQDSAGSTCGSLLPTGNAVDLVEGTPVTCIDNGMPVVCVAAEALGVTGHEGPAELEADTELRARVERLRLAAGRLMNLGDVRDKTVPKVSLLSEPEHGGVIATRTFIPHRVHEAIGVFGAVSVATACRVPGSVAAGLARAGRRSPDGEELDIEHPTGCFAVSMDVTVEGTTVTVRRAALLRTARLLMRGDAFAADFPGAETEARPVGPDAGRATPAAHEGDTE